MKRIPLLFILYAVLFWAFSSSLHAQTISNVLNPLQNPPDIAWKSIETKHFQIVFPAEIEKDAQRIANTLEHIRNYNYKTLPANSPRLTVLLFNKYADSNGMATLAPRRTEWYNVPPQQPFVGTNDWYNILGIHEFRHVIQFDFMKRNSNMCCYILGGEQGLLVAEFFSVPNWFFEGDATTMETLLSDSGRGREPSFDVELRAQLMNGIRYDYYQAMFGSYKNWDPLISPYLMGYYMVSYVRRHHGPQKWQEVLDKTTCFPVPYWFHYTLYDKTSEGAVGTYEVSMDEMEKLWRQQIRGLTITPAHTVSKGNHEDWTYYQAPQFTSSGDIIALKYGIEHQYEFVLIDSSSGRERSLFYPGPINHLNPSVVGTSIVWAETIPDPRWGQQSFSEIRIYDSLNGRKRDLSSRSKLYAPCLSPDGSVIACVEFSEQNLCSLVLLNMSDGSERARIPNPDNRFIMTPRWTPDGTHLVYTKTDRALGKALVMADIVTMKEEEVLPYSTLDSITPVSDGRYVYYCSPYSGIDNIYAFDSASRKVYQVTSRKFGAYNPALSADGRSLLFNDVTESGFAAVSMPLDPATWIPIEKIEKRSIDYFRPLVDQEAGGSILKNIPEQGFPVKDYTGPGSLFTVHSWYPAQGPDSSEVAVFVTSTNMLNTLMLSGGYIYNNNEHTHAGQAILSYAGLFPIVDISFLYGGRASTYDVKEAGEKTKTMTYSWREVTPTATLRIPLNFSRGRYTTLLEFKTGIGYTMISDMEVETAHKNNNGSFIPVSYAFNLFHGYQWIRDIYPVLGQQASISYSHTPIEGDYRGNLLSTWATFYFPGIFAHNSFFLQGAYERQREQNYRFESLILFARGYKYRFFEDFYKGGVNYTFPLFYPDLNTLGFVYVKRLFANAFYDHGAGVTAGRRVLLRSAGGELNMEAYYFTLPVPLIIGIRDSYLLDEKQERDWYSRNIEIFFSILAARI
jgi:hypothetical protein